LGKFLDLLLELAVVLDALLSRLLLDGCFEEELINFSYGQALGQIVKRSVFISPVMAVAIGLATAGEAFDQRGPQAVGQDLDLGQQKAFALAQSQRGFARGDIYPSHIYGKDMKNAADVNEKENA
jgi:hypothetical protein